jgi:hypothetical protein
MGSFSLYLHFLSVNLSEKIIPPSRRIAKRAKERRRPVFRRTGRYEQADVA